MKAYLGKILICVIPVAIACGIVAWAFHEYSHDRGGFRLGVDLVGGTILVYQVDPTKPGADNAHLNELAAALKRRIDPNDLYNVTIRPVPGDPPRVEIILPTGGQGSKLTEESIQHMRELIAQQGRLEFRILANANDEPQVLTAAEEMFTSKDAATDKEIQNRLENLDKDGQPPPAPSGEFQITVNGQQSKHQYAWVELGKEELYSLHLNNAAKNEATWKAVEAARNKHQALRTKNILPALGDGLLFSWAIPESRYSHFPEKDKDKRYEYFVLTRLESEDHKPVTGDYLDVSAIQPGRDQSNNLAVDFGFNAEGAQLFGDLTERNKPVPKDTGYKRQLAIILDGQIRSAPGLQTAITGGRGIISGNFTQTEIDQLIRILRAGALPATIIPNPVAQNSMGSTLGADTIRKGTYSVLIAFAAILIFMAIYYRFAGLVACFALLANLVLTVAFMVLVSATFTLPGLAGLVLMLGMAVDANILIYERLREERERGASLALAIRNGYDRAFPTIIDTHLSSIFTAIVLYIVGNDQLKGFGISLTVGLIISLFTSLYITRTIFDIWMGNGWLHDLKMMHLFRRPNFDFMSIRYYWFTATIILTILGGGLFIYRLDRGGLNIDFVGGTAYGGHLRTPMRLDGPDGLRARLKPAEEQLPDLSIEQIYLRNSAFTSGNASENFNIRTTEKNEKRVQEIINKALGDELDRVEMKWYPDPNEQRAELAKKDEKRSYILKFTKPGTTEPDYASLYRVRTMLQEEVALLADDAKSGDNSAAQTYLVPRNFYVEADSEPKEERYNQMHVTIATAVPAKVSEEILQRVSDKYTASPQPDRLENFDSQLAKSTQQRALLAIVLSWGAILLYLWFRFGNWTFGAAAVMCLIHDLFFTLGMIAAAHYIHLYATPVANFLFLQDFKIDLPAVAALLTLVGYSTNDTIVVFDRIREVRGKNPALTPQMINDSVNQTLSRTVLASLATWLVVVVLYFFGGDGVHLFAFVMVVGVIVGTYSSIYIASPLLLIFGEGVVKKGGPVREREPQPTETSA